MSKSLAIIHTTPVTVGSLKALTGEILKNYKVYNLLDDSILPEVIAAGEITEGVRFRFNNLLMNASTMKPDAILCACSSIGGLVDSGKILTDIPVMRIDEPMAKEAVQKATKLGVAATLPSTLSPTEALIRRKAEEMGKAIELKSMLINDVNNLLNEGRAEEYDEIVSSKLMELAQSCDVVVLAQASMARALEKIPEKDQGKFLTSPRSGIASIKELLGE